MEQKLHQSSCEQVEQQEEIETLKYNLKGQAEDHSKRTSKLTIKLMSEKNELKKKMNNQMQLLVQELDIREQCMIKSQKKEDEVVVFMLIF